MRYEPRHRGTKNHRVPKAAAVSVAATAAMAVPFMGLASPASASDGTNWDAVAQCESGGNWSTSTGNGYHGGLQFTQQTWQANGGSGNPANASKQEQIRVAENVKQTQGMGAWPVCGAKGGQAGGASQQAQQPQQQPQQQAQQQPQQRAQQPQQAPQQIPKGHGGYTVKSGDTLGKIAQKKGVDGGWHAVFNANKKTVQDPALIYPGQKLQLP